MHDASKSKEQLVNELVALRRSAEQYRRLIDEMSDGYVITRNGRIVFANRRLAEMLGQPAENLVGQPWKRFIEQQAARHIEQTPMAALPPLLEVQGLHPDGSVLDMELAVRPTTFDGKLAEFAIVRDITQRVQTQKELEKYRDHLEELVIERTAALAAANEKLYREIAERKQVEAKLRQRNRALDLLNQIGQVLSVTLDLDQVLITLLEEVRRLLDITACSVWLTDPTTGELVCQHATAPQSTTVRGWRLAPGQGIAGWVTQHGQSLIVPDADADARHFKGVDQQTGLHIRAILCAPLRVKDRVIGALEAVNVEADRFRETDLTFLESLAATAAIAIENAQMFEQARRDAETRAMLLNEVNHRVKNNLSTIIGMLYAARRYASQDEHVYHALMNDLVGRVRGLATVHDMLSASQWGPLPLSELVTQVIHSALQALPHGKDVSAKVSPSPVRVTPRQANALALCINELTTNTAKHALREHGNVSISVHISPNQDDLHFEFRDDGPGYPEKVLRLEHYGAGFDLIQNIARKSLRGELLLKNDHGAVAVIRFKK